MARKKKENLVLGTPWLNTFADLMNLLLCFFIILFALSDVNGEKFEKVSISMANSIGVFTGGGSAIGEGSLISSGMSQLNEIDQLFQSMGKTTQGKTNPEDTTNTGQKTQGSDSVMEGKDGASGDQNTEGTKGEGSQNTDGTQNSGSGQDTEDNSSDSSQGDTVGINEAMARIKEEMITETNGMYDKVSDLSDQFNLGDYMELSMDSDYQFVQMTLNGSILFDSGSADIKGAAKPILSKIGELLLKFSGLNIEIIGHTDNVPMDSAKFPDNNWLSSARALNASEYLIDVCGLDPAILKYSGRGEYEPVSSNSTAEGRAKNRRIEIRIYNKYSGR